MTTAAAASSTAGSNRRTAGAGPIVTESARPNTTCRIWLGEKAAGDGEMTGSKRPMLPRGPGWLRPGTPGSTGT